MQKTVDYFVREDMSDGDEPEDMYWSEHAHVTKVMTSKRAKRKEFILTKAVESPCVLVCVIDENDVCVGCGRLSTEVASWSFASNEEKAEIVKASSKRLKEIEQR